MKYKSTRYINAVQLQHTEFNPSLLDGPDPMEAFENRPFLEYPGWLEDAVENNQVRISASGGHDYLVLAVDCGDSIIRQAFPSDYITFYEGSLNVVEASTFEHMWKPDEVIGQLSGTAKVNLKRLI